MELAAARWTPGPADRAQAVAPAPSRAAWCLPPAALAAARRRAAAPDRGAPGAPAAAAAALAAPQRRRQRQRPRLAPAAAGSNNGVTTHGGAGDAAHAATQQLGSQDAQTDRVWTKFVAETLLPTKQGKFRLRGYRHTVDGGLTYTEPSVIIAGQPEGLEDVPVRVHDACFTSEVLGSLKCDCREQLELAMEYIRDHPPGMVIYLQQEGRGIGLANKIAAYALQEKGLDTVDANRALGLPDDCREYSAVRHILEEMGIKSIRLMTNNPRKIKEMAGLGVPVTGRIPCQVQAQKYNAGYLGAKHRRMEHLLSPELYMSEGEEAAAEAVLEAAAAMQAAADEAAADAALAAEPLEGQFCFWDHEGEPSSAGIPLEAPVDLPDGLNSAGSSMSVAGSSDGGGGRGEPGGCGSGASSASSAASLDS